MTPDEAKAKLFDMIQNDPYNDVSAYTLPDGEIVLTLSHRITTDEAVCIRIPDGGDNIAFWRDPDQRERNARTNHGGPWLTGETGRRHFPGPWDELREEGE